MHDMPTNGSYPGLLSGLDLREVRELISQDYFKFSIYFHLLALLVINKWPMHLSRIALQVAVVVVLFRPRPTAKKKCDNFINTKKIIKP